ncbi:transposable element Tcb2 transposase [Trichonephila clavipes]|nr:transposable element Tcb2 transposase [Trichonephila clavipes]
MWNVTDWQKVVFSDESRLVLGIDDNRVRGRRRPGQRYNSPHTVLHHTARTAGIMGQFSSKIMLVRIQQVLLKTSYIIFRLFHSRPAPPICPCRARVGSAKTADSVHDLELAVQDLWAHLPQDNIRCLINSMPDLVAACIAARGGATRY